MNKTATEGNSYFNYYYSWYQYCAKILGYKKCNLVGVPIWLQIKLIINNIFEEYLVSYNDELEICETSNITIEIINNNDLNNEINLIVSDTYPIEIDQIPENKRNLKTLIVKQNKEDTNRYYNKKLIKAIKSEIDKLGEIPILNVFATTNTWNTKRITEEVFSHGQRGNIRHLNVYQQESEGMRKFIERYNIY